MKLVVVVASATGRTRVLADAIAEGAFAAGAEVAVRSTEQATDRELVDADAILLGSGVHMAGVESGMSLFFERMAPLWLRGRLAGKLGAAFVSGGEGGRGGAELTLLRLLAFLAENGLLLVPFHNRLEGYRDAGCHWGVLARTNPKDGVPGPTDADLVAARAQGRYVAECTARWLTGAPG